MQQQQQQNQQFLIQQQQQFFQQFAQQQQANVGQAGQAGQAAPAEERQAQTREVRLPDFAKLAPEFFGDSSDPAVAENWVTEVEKSFKASNVSEAMKMPLAKFQLKKTANDWWVSEKASHREAVDWARFKVLFYKNYFPQSTRDEMLS